jgi:hypothetical protein
MAGRDQPSSIDRLPEEIREQIGKLRVQGRTIDEILAHLKSMDVDVSRSALGRHVKSMAALKERLQRSRTMATALVDKFGDQPDSKIQRLNIEMLHGIILEIASATEDDEETGDSRPVTFTPESAKFLAQALAQLASAQKIDQDRVLKLRAELAREATKKLDAGVKSGEIDADAVVKAKRILGFDA